MREDLPAFDRSVRHSKRYRATATIPRGQIASKIDILSRLRFMHNVQMCTERSVVTDVHAWKRHELFKLANYVNPESVAVNTRAHLRSNDASADRSTSVSRSRGYWQSAMTAASL